MNFKKILAAFFLFLTTFPLLVAIAFVLKNHLVKAEMEEKLEQQQVVSLIRSSKDFQFKEEKEIIVDGLLFDIKEIKEIEPGLFKITGLYDYQEQQLQQELEAWMNKEDNETEKQNTSVISLLSSLYDNYLAVTDSSSFKDIKTEYYCTISKKWNQSVRNINTPPPQPILFIEQV